MYVFVYVCVVDLCGCMYMCIFFFIAIKEKHHMEKELFDDINMSSFCMWESNKTKR